MKPLSTKPGEESRASPDPASATARGGDDGKLRLDAFLPYRLAMLAEQVSQSLSRLYSERYGITNPEWRVLAALGEHGTMTSTEIGRNSRMHKTKVSRAVSELEKKSLITRKTSRDDMRVAHLTLTAKGEDTYRKLVPLALQFGDRLAGGLSEEETAVLERVLTSLMERSDEIAQEISESAGENGGTARGAK